jgi:serine/threonine-protein kinase haspin
LLSDTETGELRTTIIDFGLSRAKSIGQEEPIWSRIPDDVFDGQGEQWDVYRAMKAHIEHAGNAWDGFYPVTNLMVSSSRPVMRPENRQLSKRILQWLHYLTKRLLYATPTLVKPRSKALNRIISRRDPSRSPIRRRTTRNTASALATPMTTVNTDHGAELEAWEKLRRFEIACKVGLAEWADGKLDAKVELSKKAQQGKAKSRLGGITRSEEGVVSVGDATLWFVAND